MPLTPQQLDAQLRAMREADRREEVRRDAERRRLGLPRDWPLPWSEAEGYELGHRADDDDIAADRAAIR